MTSLGEPLNLRSKNMAMDMTTPPVGACLFVGCVVGNERMEHVVKTIWPFYLAILFALLLVTYIPAISLGLGWILEL